MGERLDCECPPVTIESRMYILAQEDPVSDVMNQLVVQ